MNKIILQDVHNSLSLLDYSVLKNKTVLVTGATGMLPSYMVFTMLELNRLKNYNITVILAIRNVEKALKRFGKEILDNCNIIIKKVDFTKEFNIEQRADFIIHGASIASSHFYVTNPVETALPNTVATYHLLEKARKDNSQGFLFFSSGAVYGKIENRPTICENDSGFLDPVDIRSCYAQSKRMGENFCAAYAREYGIKTNMIRLQHTYGPTMDLNDSRVFAEFVKNIVQGNDIEMKSDGAAKRTFCYISDALDAFWRVLFLGTSGEAYNVCNNEGFYSISELAQILVSLFPEKKLKVIRTVRNSNDTYAEDKNANLVMFDDKKLRSLGWVPKISVEEGFKRTIESFLFEEK
ncbi:MAG: NAD-dependent epimerase/dehydratase family protein [Treponemataceae bacterium]